MTEQSPEQTPQKQPEFELNTSRQFVAWLAEQNLSLGFSTYQSGKVFLLGHNENGSLSVFERTFERPMGKYYGSAPCIRFTVLKTACLPVN